MLLEGSGLGTSEQLGSLLLESQNQTLQLVRCMETLGANSDFGGGRSSNSGNEKVF